MYKRFRAMTTYYMPLSRQRLLSTQLYIMVSWNELNPWRARKTECLPKYGHKSYKKSSKIGPTDLTIPLVLQYCDSFGPLLLWKACRKAWDIPSNDYCRRRWYQNEKETVFYFMLQCSFIGWKGRRFLDSCFLSLWHIIKLSLRL